MDKNQMLNVSDTTSPSAATTGEEQLRRENAELRQDNEDLRASAVWWKTLYEEALRRCSDSEPRAGYRPDVRFQMKSPGRSGASGSGATATRRAL